MLTVTPFDILVLFTLGFTAGYLYRFHLHDRLPDWNVKLTAIILTGYAFVILAYNLFLDPWTVPGFYRVPTPVAVVLFATYYYWFTTGAGVFYHLYGKYPYQDGLWWLFCFRDE